MTVTVERYVGGRDEVIARLVLSIQNDEAGLHLTLDDQPDLKDIVTAYASGGFWIASAGNEIVGCIGLLRFGSCGVVKKLFVTLPHRGRHGPAARLLASALDCARSLWMDRVVLDTPAAATRSHNFYAKAGFRGITRDHLPAGYTYPDRGSLLLGLSLSVSQQHLTHEDSMQRVVTPFGFHSTAAEVVEGVNLRGKRIVITGGAAGIGLETARVLARAGAEVTLAVRRPEAAQSVAEDLRQEAGNPEIEVRQLDLSDLRSVQAFVQDWTGPLHVLINNAGIMAVPELERTPQSFELQFGTNYLGHFALAQGLHRCLAAANGARVVSVSSSGHLFSPVVFDDLGFDFVPYTPIGAYGQSKSATALLAVGITRNWASDGITSNALNPGAIATGLQKHTGGLKTPVERRKSIEQGAATTVLLAASSLLNGISGRYFEDCNEAEQVARRPTDFTGYAAYALDPDNADRLWDVSKQLLSAASA